MNEIYDDEHVFITGMTGCGKTMLAEVYTAGMGTVIKLDTKQEYDSKRKEGKEPWYGLTEGEDYEVCHSLEQVFASEAEKIIYQIPWDEQTEEIYDELFEWAFQNGDMRIWVDELMTVCPNPHSMPKWFKACLTAGRSRNCSILMCTQRPSGIPAVCIANSTHYFVFAMPQPQDRKKMVDVTGCMELDEKPDRYVFWYYRQGMDEGEARQGRLILDD